MPGNDRWYRMRGESCRVLSFFYIRFFRHYTERVNWDQGVRACFSQLGLRQRYVTLQIVEKFMPLG
jgi:hypothetical protein